MYQSKIRINYPSAYLARSVRNALAPDDRATSGSVRVISSVRGRALSITVTGANRIETLEATVQDIFRCIAAAENLLMKLR